MIKLELVCLSYKKPLYYERVMYPIPLNSLLAFKIMYMHAGLMNFFRVIVVKVVGCGFIDIEI